MMRYIERVLPKLCCGQLIAALSVATAACSGHDSAPDLSDDLTASSEPPGDSAPDDGASDPPQWTAEGVYTGVLKSDTQDLARDVVAFADSWGYTRFVTEDGQYYGFPNMPDFPLTGIAAFGRTWPDGSRKSTFAFDLVSSTDLDREGTFAGAGDEGTWKISREPLRSGRPDEGLYVQYDDSLNISATFEITASGGTSVISGTNTDGCVFNGFVRHDDWLLWYVYEASIKVENCPETPDANLNGDYAGMGGMTPNPDGVNPGLSLTIGVDNDDQSLILVLEKL